MKTNKGFCKQTIRSSLFNNEVSVTRFDTRSSPREHKFDQNVLTRSRNFQQLKLHCCEIALSMVANSYICCYHWSCLSSMAVLWWMEASFTVILILPCIFIMAPRVTPGRCTKCPASCHRCPPLYLCNLFLLLALSSPPPPPTLLFFFGSSRTHKCLPGPYKCDVLLQLRRGCVLSPSKEFVMFIVCMYLRCCLLSALLSVAITLHLALFFFLLKVQTEWNAMSGAQVSLCRRWKGKTSCPPCEHRDPATINLATAWSLVPDSSNNFPPCFQAPLSHWDRLTLTTRFWLHLTWVWTGPWGRTAEWGLNWADRQWLWC